MLPADSGPHGLGRVVLVGNGPSIRTRALGGTIDSFDTVIRFNSFITRGLERHTGAKTSVWCHMMQWYHVGGVEPAARSPFVPVRGFRSREIW
jgi:hypothetical protein